VFKTYADSVLAAADNCGCVSYIEGLQIAADHGLINEYKIEYKGGAIAWRYGVDAGELLVWLGY